MTHPSHVPCMLESRLIEPLLRLRKALAEFGVRNITADAVVDGAGVAESLERQAQGWLLHFPGRAEPVRADRHAALQDAIAVDTLEVLQTDLCQGILRDGAGTLMWALPRDCEQLQVELDIGVEIPYLALRVDEVAPIPSGPDELWSGVVKELLGRGSKLVDAAVAARAHSTLVELYEECSGHVLLAGTATGSDRVPQRHISYGTAADRILDAPVQDSIEAGLPDLVRVAGAGATGDPQWQMQDGTGFRMLFDTDEPLAHLAQAQVQVSPRQVRRVPRACFITVLPPLRLALEQAPAEPATTPAP